MSPRTRSDLPDPDAPKIRMASSPSATQLACNRMLAAASVISAGLPIFRKCGNAHDEPRPQYRALAARGRFSIAVLGPDAALMGFDDLARNRQSETGILAEGAFRTIGIEALEDALEILRRNARALILDAELDIVLNAPHAEAYRRT